MAVNNIILNCTLHPTIPLNSESEARREREKWIVSLAECLFFVLDQSSSSVGGTTSPSVGDTRELGSCSSITYLAPILASMFLDVVLSLNANASEDLQNIQWAFWELAKVPLTCMLRKHCVCEFSVSVIDNEKYSVLCVYMLFSMRTYASIITYVTHNIFTLFFPSVPSTLCTLLTFLDSLSSTHFLQLSFPHSLSYTLFLHSFPTLFSYILF